MTPDGGCLCGRIRYRLGGPPLDAGYCHCTICRRSTGSPVVAWGTWSIAELHWLQGDPRLFASSAKGRRRFCADCGTQLTFVYADSSSLVDVTLASLDDPEAIQPEYHVWTGTRIGWLEMTDRLPRYEDGGPDTELMAQHGD